MILWVFFFCLPSIAVILGESPADEGYDERVYAAELPGGRIDQNSNPQVRISKFLGSGSAEDTEESEEGGTPRRGILDREVADQLEGNGWLDVIPGTPGKDYPSYERIPETSFACDDKTAGGYYADIEARCQVFHVCDSGGKKSSFLCPSGSIFNQKYLVCDWWYDFECDDATDLYSLNEKINRGGTGSGPSGPGRVEYYQENENFSGQEEPRNEGNFVSADGFDLSLAGTGEGGPGYARNGNNRGYQSNVNDEEDRDKEDAGNEGRGTRRKNVNGKKISGELSKLDYSQASGDKQDENWREGFSPPGSGKNREQEPGVFRKRNSAAGNPGVNYQGGYGSGNPSGPPKTLNFRPGNGGIDRAEKSNRFIEHRNNPRGRYSSANTPGEENGDDKPRGDTRNYENPEINRNRKENGRGFGQRSETGSPRNDYLAPKVGGNDYNRGSPSSGSSSGLINGEFTNGEAARDEERKNSDQGGQNNRRFNSDRISAPSSGPDNDEYRNRSPSGGGPANVRARQRTSGGLPGGLGNGYPSPGRARELPGSDAIASGITRAGGETVYDEGDQRSLGSQHKASNSGTRNASEVNDVKKIRFDRQMQGSDFREDEFSPGEDSRGGQPPKNRKYPGPSSSSRDDKSPDSNYRETSSRVTDRRRQSSGKNDGNDYLVGIVPGTEVRVNGTSDSNQQRRYLPIL